MTFIFSAHLPANFYETPVVISGQNSLQFNKSEYLIIQDKVNNIKAFKIKYTYHCSPFKEAALCNDILAVGHGNHFYLYEIKMQQHLLILEMSGYFGHFYIYQERFYICDASNLYSINTRGNIIWEKTNLGVDGVIIHQFKENKIYGSGECDPPEGWIDFVLDIETGKPMKEERN